MTEFYEFGRLSAATEFRDANDELERFEERRATAADRLSIDDESEDGNL